LRLPCNIIDHDAIQEMNLPPQDSSDDLDFIDASELSDEEISVVTGGTFLSSFGKLFKEVEFLGEAETRFGTNLEAAKKLAPSASQSLMDIVEADKSLNWVRTERNGKKYVGITRTTTDKTKVAQSILATLGGSVMATAAGLYADKELNG